MAEPRKNPLLAVSGGKKREQSQEKPMSRDEIMNAFAPDDGDNDVVVSEPEPVKPVVDVQPEPARPVVDVQPEPMQKPEVLPVQRQRDVREEVEAYRAISHEPTLYSVPVRAVPVMPQVPPSATPISSYEQPVAFQPTERVTIELPPMPPVKRKRHRGLRFGDIYETRSLSIDKRLLPYFDDYLESGDTKTALANQIVLKILIDAGYPIDPAILTQPFKKAPK